MNVPAARRALSALFVLFALSASSADRPARADPVDRALLAFERLEGYRATLRSSSGEVIRYFFKKPGFVRMEFERPHRGAVLVYDPVKKEARLRPLRFWRSLELRLSPGDSLITSARGHTVDESDIGSLLERVRRLGEGGTVEAAGTEAVSGRGAIVVAVKGAAGAEAADGVAGYTLWLDAALMLPVKVRAWSAGGELVEEVLMDDLVVDPELPMDLFS